MAHWYREALQRGWVPVESVQGFFIIAPSLPSAFKVISSIKLRERAKVLGTHVGALDAILQDIQTTIENSTHGYDP